MTYETVIGERAKDGRVGILTMNRPEKLNAWNTQFVNDMSACLTEFKEDPDVNVVIIKANGKHFSAGMDFSEAFDKPADTTLAFFKKMMTIRSLLHSMPQITIAQVHGTAAAFGTHLVWFCDLAVASEDAKFGAPPINIGLG